MNKQLNIDKIQQVMAEKGLSQANLSEALSVSRTIVSNWLKGEKFPRPNKLLKLGMTLGLPFDQIVIKEVSPTAPVVSFRKKQNRKTREEHFEGAADMGRLLELLAEFSPFDNLVQPPTLKQPSTDYTYLQRVVTQIRKDIGVGNNDSVNFEQLIHKFSDLEVVIIPVLWGSKENHGKALRIYLPASKTTWIYLNLDSYIHDFLFWMVHELGHVMSPSLQANTDESEDFADQFAQAFLFPETIARKVYKEVQQQTKTSKRVSVILSYAKKHMISPVTVYKALNTYANHRSLKPFNFDGSLYGATAKFNKKHKTVSESLNGGKGFTAESYIEASEKVFKTPFFKILKKYLSATEKSFGFIQIVLATTLLDAKEIHADLTR